jgi:hypothetical protein
MERRMRMIRARRKLRRELLMVLFQQQGSRGSNKEVGAIQAVSAISTYQQLLAATVLLAQMVM